MSFSKISAQQPIWSVANHTAITPALSAKSAWKLLWAGFICSWLLFGFFIQQASAEFLPMAGYNPASLLSKQSPEAVLPATPPSISGVAHPASHQSIASMLAECGSGSYIHTCNPDLSIESDDIHLQDESLGIKQILNIEIVVHNRGTDPGSATIKVFDRFNNVDTEIKEYVIEDLAVNASDTEQLAYSVKGPVGSHEIKVLITLTDSNDPTGNHEASKAYIVKAPDFVLDPLALSNIQPIIGETVTATATVKNTGNFIASGAISYYLKYGTNRTFLTSLGFFDLPTTGEVVNRSITFESPEPVGTHEICAVVVDAKPGEETTALANNEKCKSFEVKLPTYQYEVTIQDAASWQGGQTSALALINNTGTGPITITNATLSGGNSNLTLTPVSTLPIRVAAGKQAQISFKISVATALNPVPPTFPVDLPLVLTVFSQQAGNVTAPFNFQVYATPTLLTVKVVNSKASNAPLAGTWVVVEGNEQLYTTAGSEGSVTVETAPGYRNVLAYRPGFVAKVAATDVIEGVTTNSLTFGLVPGPSLSITSTVAMTLTAQQIKDLGLNVGAGSTAYTFTIHAGIPYTTGAIIIPDPGSVPSGTQITKKGVGEGVGTGYPEQVGYSCTFTYFTDPNGDPQRSETWMIVPGEIQFLKQFWQVLVYVKNSTASGIYFESLQATLTTPAGLGLPLNDAVKPLSPVPTDPLAVNEGREYNWIVRGDIPGKHTLLANVGGYIKFIFASTVAIDINVAASSPEIVVIEPTIDARYDYPGQVKANEAFTLTATLTNTSPITLSQVVVELKDSNIQNGHVDPKDEPRKLLTSDMVPNASQSITFSIIPTVSGCFKVEDSKVTAARAITPRLIFVAPGEGGCGEEPPPSKPKHNLGNCSCNCDQADPCTPATGNYHETFEDLALPSAANSSLYLGIQRTYNAQDDSTGMLGKGWRFSYDTQLIPDTDTVLVINPDGRQDEYRKKTDGSYTAPSRANSTLVKTSNGYELTSVDLVTYTFNTTGVLQEIKDRNGNWLQITHGAGGLVSGVQDNFGRSFTFSFTADGKRIKTISDGQRTVEYGYDTTSTYLKTVKDVRGQIFRYDYSANNLLDRKYDQKNRLLMKNIYDSQNRVTQQTTYDGLGGEFNVSFDYSQAGKVIYTDQRGYKTTFAVDSVSLLPVGITNPEGNSRSATRNANDDITVFTATNGAIFRSDYSAAGRPTAFTSTVTANGVMQDVTTKASYDPILNVPTVVTDTRGGVTRYGYDAKGNMVAMTDTEGLVTNYQYNGQARLTKLILPNGLVMTYEYNALGQTIAMTKTYNTIVPIIGSTPGVPKTEQHSYRTNYQYTPQGWLLAQSEPYEPTDPNSPILTTTYEYDEAGHTRFVTNPLGQRSENRYDEIGNLVQVIPHTGAQTFYEYDALGRVLITTQFPGAPLPALVSLNTYDEAGNLATTQDPRGVKTNFGYDKVNRLVTTTTQLQSGELVKTINSYDAMGNLATTTRYNNNGHNQVTKYDYDELNRLVTTTHGLGYRNYQSVTIYDAAGNVLETRQSKVDSLLFTAADWQNPSKVVTSANSYDSKGRVIQTRVLGNNNQNLVTSYSYDNVRNLRTTTDPYGVVSIAESNPAGQSISSTLIPSANGAAAQIKKDFRFYNSRGLNFQNWSGNNFGKDEVSHDKLGRAVVQTRYTDFNNPASGLTTLLFYTDTTRPQITIIGPAPQYERQDMIMDELGQLVRLTTYTGKVDYSTNLISVLPTGALTTEFSYDAQGNQTVIKAPNGYETHYTYENTGWLRTVSSAVTPTGQSMRSQITTYTYDLLGNKIATTDAEGRTSTATFDVLSRLIHEQPAASKPFSYTYDGLNRLTEKYDAKGQLTTFSYDNASRLLNMTTGNIQTMFEYNNLSSNPTARKDQVGANPLQTTNFAYNGLNQLSSLQTPQGNITYGYDGQGRINKVEYGQADGQVQTLAYQRDGQGRLTSVEDQLYNHTTAYQYEGARLKNTVYPNGITAAYSFDGAARLTGIVNSKQAATLFSVNYTLDSLGNRVATQENINGTNRQLNYGYDELNRLISETQQIGTSTPVTTTYKYDLTGNRTQLVTTLPSNIKGNNTPLVLTTNYQYNSAGWLTQRQEVGSATPFSAANYNYTYDDNGSVLNETSSIANADVINYNYDARNRLVNWQRNRGATTLNTVSFAYDGADNRTNMTQQGKSTSYLVDPFAFGLPVVLQEVVSGQTGTNNFSYAFGSTAPLHQRTSTGTQMWYHNDGLGSVRLLSGASGNVLSSHAYNSFGENAAGGVNGKVSNDNLYTGEQLDPTGLYYLRARYYNPALGRFTSRDTYKGAMTLSEDINRYSYATNNPVLYSDPSGYSVYMTVVEARQLQTKAQQWSGVFGGISGFTTVGLGIPLIGVTTDAGKALVDKLGLNLAKLLGPKGGGLIGALITLIGSMTQLYSLDFGDLATQIGNRISDIEMQEHKSLIPKLAPGLCEGSVPIKDRNIIVASDAIPPFNINLISRRLSKSSNDAVGTVFVTRTFWPAALVLPVFGGIVDTLFWKGFLDPDVTGYYMIGRACTPDGKTPGNTKEDFYWRKDTKPCYKGY